MPPITPTKKEKTPKDAYLATRLPLDIKEDLNKATATTGVKVRHIVSEALRCYLPGLVKKMAAPTVTR